jgi:hypothetical protein
MLSQRYSGDVCHCQFPDRNLHLLQPDPGPYICDGLVLGPPAVAFIPRVLCFPLFEGGVAIENGGNSHTSRCPLSQILTNLARYRGFFVRITSLL